VAGPEVGSKAGIETGIGGDCTYAQLECYSPDFPSDFHGKEYFYYSSVNRPKTDLEADSDGHNNISASLLPVCMNKVVNIHRTVCTRNNNNNTNSNTNTGGTSMKSLKYGTLNALDTIDIFMQEVCSSDSTLYCTSKCADIHTAGEKFKKE